MCNVYYFPTGNCSVMVLDHKIEIIWIRDWKCIRGIGKIWKDFEDRYLGEDNYDFQLKWKIGHDKWRCLYAWVRVCLESCKLHFDWILLLTKKLESLTGIGVTQTSFPFVKTSTTILCRLSDATRKILGVFLRELPSNLNNFAMYTSMCQ